MRIRLDVKELISDLNRAYADEWLAFYCYWYMTKTVSGSGHENIRKLLEKVAKEELEHAGELAQRIQQLGGLPLSNPIELEKNANVSYPRPPKSTSDHKSIVKVVADSEAGAIDVYEKIVNKTKDKDQITYQLASHILAEELGHKEMFDSLLA